MLVYTDFFYCLCLGLDGGFLKTENVLFSFVALTLNTAGARPQSRCPVNVEVESVQGSVSFSMSVLEQEVS